VFDFKPLVVFMKYFLERYGLWRFALLLLAAIAVWRLPELITSIR